MRRLLSKQVFSRMPKCIIPALLALFLSACQSAPDTSPDASHATAFTETAIASNAAPVAASTGTVIVASWYQCCRRTANGERFNPDGLTAAHKTLPFGTRVHVTNMANNRTVTVRINDRGPFTPGRGLDLSRGAAREIGCISTGTCRVSMRLL